MSCNESGSKYQGASMSKEVIIPTIVLFLGVLVLGWFVCDLLKPTIWQLVKVEENGKEFYAIQACHPHGCNLIGYRYTMDERAEAEEKWQEFVKPDPVTRVIEVVK